MVASGRLDYRRLLDLARERDMVSIVGCYLDILNGIQGMVDPEVIGDFEARRSGKRLRFLPGESAYGKGGWEGEYEEKWNLDLYLDLGAIRHGVRSI
jgi:hypothetical protein